MLKAELIDKVFTRLYEYSDFEKRRSASYDEGNYNLKTITNLLEVMGNPQNDYFIIHVAGTKGKGTCVHYLSHFLEAMGLRTGHTLSPQVLDERDRFYTRGKRSDYEEIIPCIEYVLDLVNIHGLFPTVFDIFTAVAFEYFFREKIEVAVVEVGMGGRWDSTNVVQSVVSMITLIDFDHTDKLGNTLKEIASEKAGIIKPNQKVFYLRQSQQVNQVIEATAKKQGAEPIAVDGVSGRHYVLDAAWKLLDDDLIKNNQALKQNLNLVLAYLLSKPNYLFFKREITEDLILEIMKKSMVARNQRVGNNIFDGAHTPKSIENLVATISSGWGDDKITRGQVVVYFYCLYDKAVEELLVKFPKSWELVWLDPEFFYMNDDEVEKQYQRVSDFWRRHAGKSVRKKNEGDLELVLAKKEVRTKEKIRKEKLVSGEYNDEIRLFTGSFRMVGWVLVKLEKLERLNI